MKNTRFNFNAKDGAGIFIWLLLGNLIFSFIYVAICSHIATAQEIKIDVLWQQEIFVYINMIVTQLLYLAIYFIYNKVNHIKMIPATRLKTKPNWIVVLTCIGLGLVCLFGANYFVGLFDFVVYKISGVPAQSVGVSNTIWSFLLSTIFIALVPAILEEVIFRGMIFNGFKSKLKVTHAVLLSALIFAFMHMSISQFVYQFALGIVFALICHVTGSTIYSIITHFVNNFTVLVISFIDSDVFVNTKWGFWEVFGAIAILLGAIALVIVIIKFLQKYCKKHKTAAKVTLDKPEIEVKLEQAEGLSEYEIRQLNPAKISDKGWILISIIAGAIVWIFSIF